LRRLPRAVSRQKELNEHAILGAEPRSPAGMRFVKFGEDAKAANASLKDLDGFKAALKELNEHAILGLVVQLVDDCAWRFRWQIRSGVERIDRIGPESSFDQRRHIW